MSEHNVSESVVRAEQVLRDLVAKRDKLNGRAEQISQERKSVGFQVHAEHDKAARRRLDELNNESAKLSGELESVEAAISEAGVRLDAAKAAAERAADQEKARKLREVIKRASELKIDEHLEAAIADLNKLFLIINDIHHLGSEFPTHLQARQNIALAVKGQLARLPTIWRNEFELGGALINRRTISGYLENVSQVLERDISIRLEERVEEPPVPQVPRAKAPAAVSASADKSPSSKWSPPADWVRESGPEPRVEPRVPAGWLKSNQSTPTPPPDWVEKQTEETS
jgi:chromosome segregation ATPase